ncbi:magnesium transporter, partial [Dimargaris cristalligena]
AGLVLLLHAGYSTYEHLAYLKAIGHKVADSSIPIDIVVECLVASFLAIVGAIYVTPELKPIALEHEMKKLTIDGVDGRSSFRVFNHRG